ncbi:MAG: FGGY family carbohydrate kinase [Candidatus Promineifilaceae bacterium]
MMEALLGIDVGTTSTKAVLFDRTGTELARAISPPYPNHTPNPGWVEQDPEDLWQAVLSVVRGVMAAVDREVHVQALCMATQSGSVLAVDANGEPVYRFITWMDGRTESLANQWRENGFEDQVKAVSGWSLYPGSCLLSIAWLHDHQPGVFAASQKYVSVNDFITFRLTGAYCTNPSNAGGMVLLDIHTGQWSEDLCSLAAITSDHLSPIQPAGTVIGEITPDICRATGLPKGTLLVNGGHDQGCTTLGLGIISPGKLLLACGTAWVITGVTDSPEIDQAPSALELNFHPAPDRWTISQSLGGLGASLEWWINQAWRGVSGQVSRKEAFAALDDELAQTQPGSGGLTFLPFTGGHVDGTMAKVGGFLGLQLDHSRADMARAIMESAAFELRWALEAIQEASLPVDRLWMVGGAAQSTYWPAILANASNVPICLPRYDNWPALGAAILAGIGIGLFESVDDGLSHFRKPVEDIEPVEAMRTLYEANFASYKAFAQKLRMVPAKLQPEAWLPN